MGFKPVLMLAVAGGFVSLSYEIFFFRTVSYATASSATAFAAILSAFLVGLASGARQAGEPVPRSHPTSRCGARWSRTGSIPAACLPLRLSA